MGRAGGHLLWDLRVEISAERWVVVGWESGIRDWLGSVVIMMRD